MSVFEKVLSNIVKKPDYGHVRGNIENIESLRKANAEIGEMMKKNIKKEINQK